MERRFPILLDTDIGSDIDDALCLSYLLRQPRCELVGITTVSGQPQVRAALADALCQAAGRSDVPVFAGLELDLRSGNVVQPDVPQARVLSALEHRPAAEFAPNSAVPFLRDAIRSRPGELTLLAIGPLTNLAVLFALDPELPGLLRGLVSMSGIFTRAVVNAPLREWNVLCDPLAAHVVYRSNAARHVSVGLDVTLRCRTSTRACLERFSELGGPFSVLTAMTEAWAASFGEGAGEVVFHDPLAAALLFEPELCTYEAGHVSVELESPRLSGLTHFEPDLGGPHRVAVEVDAGAFLEHFWSACEAGA